MTAQNAQTAGWSARFIRAVPVAVLTVLLGALVTFLGWISISLTNLRSDAESLDTRVTALEARVEQGFEQTNARLTRLETRMDALNGSVNDIYKLLAERLPPPPEKEQP